MTFTQGGCDVTLLLIASSMVGGLEVRRCLCSDVSSDPGTGQRKHRQYSDHTHGHSLLTDLNSRAKVKSKLQG